MPAVRRSLLVLLICVLGLSLAGSPADAVAAKRKCAKGKAAKLHKGARARRSVRTRCRKAKPRAPKPAPAPPWPLTAPSIVPAPVLPPPALAPAPAPTPAPAPPQSPTAAPAPTVSASPAPEPTSTPSPEPTAQPTPEPTIEPTPAPTAEPTPAPTAEPTAAPTAEPTPAPTAEPTAAPTAEPTPAPTAEPTAAPTAEPTPAPTAEPTAAPTAEPTVEPAPTATPEPDGQLLFTTDYAAASRSLSGAWMAGVWHATQVPNHGIDTADQREYDRIRVIDAPGDATDPQQPGGKVMHVELRPYDDPDGAESADGDVTNTGGYLANRAEVFDRYAGRKVAAEQWPDPVGAERWYSWSLYIPADFQLGPKTRWLDLTQWKGLNTGSPPVALEIAGTQFRVGGDHLSLPLGAVTPGRWTTFTFGMRLSAHPAVGWVNVFRDGAEVVAKTSTATMSTYTKDGATMTDPTYFKQGIYRSASWTVTHQVDFGPVRIGTTRASVGG